MTTLKKVSSLVGTATLIPFLDASTAFAQLSTTTPGVPTTGLGGAAMSNFILLTISALAIIGGAFYIKKGVES
jgi:hypothetical protein